MRPVSGERLSTDAKTARKLGITQTCGGDPLSEGHASLCHRFGDLTSRRHRFGGSNAHRIGDKVPSTATPQQNGTMGKFPNGVAAALEAAGISQADLARRVGESRQQIGRIVKCERKLTLVMATKLAPVLKVDVRELFVPADHHPSNSDDDQREFLADKARLLDQIASFSPDQQAEILSEALSMMARRQRSEP